VGHSVYNLIFYKDLEQGMREGVKWGEVAQNGHRICLCELDNEMTSDFFGNGNVR
jgi:hypothetical protein